jgi:Esterase FrsA-like
VCLHFGKFVWVLDAAAHRTATERAIAAMSKAHAFLDPTAERIEARLDGGVLAGNLRRPASEARPPLILLIPGLDSTKEEFFHWENAFLTRGMATLSMDGPCQGETGFRLPIRHDYEVAVGAILDTLGARADLDLDLDLERVGAAGVSLGGYYAPRAAAFEPRIRAVAGISGPYNFGELWDDLPPLTREAFTVKSGARTDRDGRERAHALDLSGVLGALTQPALHVTGGLDRIIPWRQTERAARETPDGVFVLYGRGTHVCSNIPYRYRPLVADWMWDQLSGSRA